MMNNMRFKKAIANKVVDAAVQTMRLSNQICVVLFGKPNAKFDLTIDDYEQMQNFIEQN